MVAPLEPLFLLMFTLESKTIITSFFPSCFSAEVKMEFNPPPPKVDYTSTTKKDFSRGRNH